MRKRAFGIMALGCIALGGAAIFVSLGNAALFYLSPQAECSGATMVTQKGTSISFSRSSAATCTTGAGLLVTLASNKPRTSGAGLLVEGPATNKALYSEQIDPAVQATWSKTESGATVTISSDTTDVADPFGTNNAEKLVFSATSGAQTAYVCQTFTATASSSVGSLYVRTASGTGTAYLWVKQGSTYFRGTCSATAGWDPTTGRCSTGAASLAGSSSTFCFGVDLGDGGQTGKAAQTLYVFGAQIEQGNASIPTSYIPTTSAAVTRSADVPTVSGVVVGASMSAAATITLTQYNSDQSDAVYWLEGYNGGSDQIAMKVTSAGKVSCVAFNGTLYTTLSSGTVSLATPTRVGCTFAAGAIQACIAGTCDSGAATLTSSSTYPVSLGMSNGSSTRWLRGLINNICIDNTLTGCPTS